MINLLVVEDDRDHMEYCVGILRSFGDGINILTAQSAEEALDVLSKQSVDGIYIDIELPGMNGFKLAEKIRKSEAYHFLPIIFATGTVPETTEPYRKYHNLDYIQKPFKEKSFKEKTQRLIAEIEAQKKKFLKTEEREIPFDHERGRAHIPVSEILYASTAGGKNKVSVVTRSETYNRSHLTLSNVIVEFGDDVLVRCHKGFAVNVANIEDIRQIPHMAKTWEIFFKNAPGESCLLSLKHRDEILGLFEKRLNKGLEDEK